MKQGAGCRGGPSSWWLGGEVTDLGTHTQFSCTQSVPGQPWGLPCMCHLTLYVGSGSDIGTVNSGSPLTPAPSSLIDCEEEPCPSWRGEQEGTFSPRAAEASRRRHKRGSLAVQRQYFAVHSKRASSCLWILSVLLVISKSCSRWLSPQLLLDMLCTGSSEGLIALEGAALSCLPFV